MATKQITITAPDIRVAQFFIKGTAPLVVHKFSQKAIMQMRQKQELGSLANKSRKKDAKDFHECFMNSRHISLDGWDGFPASSFRCALIQACKLVEFKMTLAKLSIFIKEDGFDNTEGTPLVRIYCDKAEQYESMVRIGGGMSAKVADISVRAMYKTWGCILNVKYDAAQFSHDDIGNLLLRVGIQCGIGEGRPSSKESAGVGWGTFEFTDENDEIFKEKKEKSK